MPKQHSQHPFEYAELLQDRNSLLHFVLLQYLKSDQVKLIDEDKTNLDDLDLNSVDVSKVLAAIKKGVIIDIRECLISREISSQPKPHITSSQTLKDDIKTLKIVTERFKRTILCKGLYETILLSTNFMDSVNINHPYFQLLSFCLLRNTGKSPDFTPDPSFDLNDEKFVNEAEQIKRNLLKCITKRSQAKNTGLFYRFYLLLQIRPSDFSSWQMFLEWQERQIKIFCESLSALFKKRDFQPNFEEKLFPHTFSLQNAEIDNHELISQIDSSFSHHLLLSLNSDNNDFEEKITKSLRKIHDDYIEKIQQNLSQIESITKLSSSPMSSILTDLRYPPSIAIKLYDYYIYTIFQISRSIVKHNSLLPSFKVDDEENQFTDVTLDDKVEFLDDRSNSLYQMNPHFEVFKQSLSDFLNISPSTHLLATRKYQYYYLKVDRKLTHPIIIRLISSMNQISTSIPSEEKYKKDTLKLIYDEIKREILSFVPQYHISTPPPAINNDNNNLININASSVNNNNNGGDDDDDAHSRTKFVQWMNILCDLNDRFKYDADQQQQLFSVIISKSVSLFYHQFYGNQHINFNDESHHPPHISSSEFLSFLHSLSSHLCPFFDNCIKLFEEFYAQSKEVAITEIMKLFKINLSLVLKGISSLNIEVCKLQNELFNFFDVIQKLSNSAELSIGDLQNNVLEPFFSPLVQNWIQEQEIKRAEFMVSAFKTETWQPMDEKNRHCVSISDLILMIKQCFPILFSLQLKSLQEFFFLTIIRTFSRTLSDFTTRITKNCHHSERLKLPKQHERVQTSGGSIGIPTSLSSFSSTFKNFATKNNVNFLNTETAKIPPLDDRFSNFFKNQNIDILAVRLNSLEYAKKQMLEIKDSFDDFIDNQIHSNNNNDHHHQKKNDNNIIIVNIQDDINQNSENDSLIALKENIQLLLNQILQNIDTSIDQLINYISTLVVYFQLRTPFVSDLYASKVTHSQIDLTLKLLFPKIILICNLLYDNLVTKVLQSMLITTIDAYEWVLFYSPNRFFSPDQNLFFIEDIKKLENFFTSHDDNYPLPKPLDLEVIQEWTFGIKMVIMDLFHLPTTSLTKRCDDALKLLASLSEDDEAQMNEVKNTISSLISVLHHRSDQSARRYLSSYYSTHTPKA